MIVFEYILNLVVNQIVSANTAQMIAVSQYGLRLSNEQIAQLQQAENRSLVRL